MFIKALDSTRPEIHIETENPSDNLLSTKSKEKYISAYENFIQWRKAKSEDQSFSEDVFLDYFKELNRKYKPSTLWCIFSMIKSIISAKYGLDIKTYQNLTEYIRKSADGFIGKKSNTLSQHEVEKFLKEAPDSQYLATKVALIFGISGACGSQDLLNITTKDIENHGKMLLVKVTNTKSKIPRSFVIRGPFYDIVKKYEALRSTKAKNSRFFQNYQKGKCTCQPIGVNKFGNMAREIAKFLGLPDADSYTAHSFRRTSATLLVDPGTDLVTLKSQERESLNDGDLIQNETKESADISIEPDTKQLNPEPSTSNKNSLLDS